MRTAAIVNSVIFICLLSPFPAVITFTVEITTRRLECHDGSVSTEEKVVDSDFELDSEDDYTWDDDVL